MLDEAPTEARKLHDHLKPPVINAVRFWGEVNAYFFKGTMVDRQAADVLARGTAWTR